MEFINVVADDAGYSHDGLDATEVIFGHAHLEESNEETTIAPSQDAIIMENEEKKIYDQWIDEEKEKKGGTPSNQLQPSST